MVKQPSADSVLTMAGIVAVSIGTYLPWFRVDPRFDPLGTKYPEVYTSLAEPGIHGGDLVLLGVVATILCFQFVWSKTQISALVSVVTGTGILLYNLQYPVSHSVIGLHGMIVPVSGLFLTVLGGACLTAAGLHQMQNLRTLSSPNGTGSSE